MWDRGPSDGGDEPPIDGRGQETAGRPLGVGPDEDPTEPVPAAPSGSDGSTDADLAAAPAAPVDDSVWTRGPAIDDVATEPAPPRASVAPVLPPPQPPRPTRRRVVHRVRRRTGLLVMAAVAVVVGMLAWSFGLVGADQSAEPAPAAPTTTTPVLVPNATVPPAAVTTSPTTVPATVPTTLAPTTTEPVVSTTLATTTTTSTTVPPTTTAPPTTTVPETVAIAGPQVAIVGRVAACKFGPSCLIADFSIAGFDTPQREFVCDFGNGNRYTFRFDGDVDGDGVEQACATGSADGSITVEVAGVRSQTVTR